MNSATIDRDWTIDDALQTVRQLAPHLHVTGARQLGGGIEFQVFAVELASGAPLVAKFPQQRWIFNDNDQGLDSFRLLAQDKFLLEFAARAGLPAPAVNDFLKPDAGPQVLLLELIEGDGSTADDLEVGQVVRRLHDLPPPDLALVAQRGEPASHVVADLTVQRMAVAARLAGGMGAAPDAALLKRLLAPIDRAPRLLHMDCRPANYLCRHGRLGGLIDWSNALHADPLLELARIAEYGGLSDRFAAGYGLETARRRQLDDPLGLCCRLYTAAMLAVVFLSEAPDPDLARERVARLKELLARLDVAVAGRQR